MVVNTLQPRRGRRKEEMVVTTLPFPMLIPVDDNDLKSLALSVDVAGSKTLVAQESEGGVTGRTEAASRNPSTTRHEPNGTTQRHDPTPCPQRKPKLDNGHLYQCVLSHVNEERS